MVALYKDDVNGSQVAERLLARTQAAKLLPKEQYRKIASQLSAHLTNEINLKIQEMLKARHHEIIKEQKTKNQIAQLEREKRILQSNITNSSLMQTAQRSEFGAARKEKPVLGNLSVVMGGGKRGNIVVRDGDDVKELVKNFIQLYGLKKDLFPTILGSLNNLLATNQQVQTVGDLEDDSMFHH